MSGSAAPGAWLRLTALGGVLATGLVVASGELGLAHRALALAALPPLVALVAAAWTAHPRLRVPAASALALLLGEIALGGLVSLTGAAWAEGLHVAAAVATLGTAAWLAAASYRAGDAAAQVRPREASAWRDYITLTKPRIMSLLLVTGACGMFAGERGAPPALDLAVLVLGLALACGGASALNHVLDRDIDRLMGKRTRRRPVAAGRVAPSSGLEFGLALSAASFVLLATLANPLTALLALAGNLFYVLVYTGWLKRSTPQNIVIGGAAGAVPPLVGWAAATGSIGLPALFLFAIVFVWTPPHFWALALLIRKDYEAARVPMLPVVRGVAETTRQIVAYSVGLAALTLVPVATGTFGVLYGVAAALLGGTFVWLAWRLLRETTPPRAAALFHYSLAYLALLFVAVAIDPLVL
jgi:protoheme IX farnesyltransferase